MQIATWNVNSINVRKEQLLEWLSSHSVDVIAIQETKCMDENFPADAFTDAGYKVLFTGQKTYNGVAILYKGEADTPVTAIPNFADEQKRFLSVCIDGVQIVNVYVPNGQSVDSDKYNYKLNWLKALKAYVKAQLVKTPNMVILGDYNIAPTDNDVHDPVMWEGGVLVSPKERKALQDLLDMGFVDTYRLFDESETAYSWWDYRGGAFRRNHGLRIDHILASTSFAKGALSASIDIEPRTWERPSDHTIVMAEFNAPIT